MCAWAAFFMSCGPHPTVVTLGGSEVVGTLVRQNGTTVAGATVKLDTAANSSDTSKVIVLDSTTTDAKGNFSFKRNHGGGTFSIYGNYNHSELVVLHRNVKDTVTSDVFHKVSFGTDTMLPPGFISGKVIIDEASLTGTICYIPGTSLMAITGDDGSFVMSGVPQGTYNVYFFYPSYTVGHYSGATVKSGETKNIGTFILSYDPTKPVPAPRSVTVAYDTVHGVAVVSWHAVHVSDLKGYFVIRGLNGKFDTTTISAADTIFHDTIYRSFADLAIDTCQYQVAAFDSGSNTSSYTNPTTLITVPPASVRTVFAFSVTGAINDTAEIGDTVVISARFSNVNNLNNVVLWYSSYPDSVLKQDSVKMKSGADTLRHLFTSSGRAALYVVAVDDHGNSWLDSIVVAVRPHHVDAVSFDSTTTGVTIKWNESHQLDFASYRLYRTSVDNDTLLYTTTARADTSHTALFTKNGVFQYRVVVADSQGRYSPPGKSIAARIKNTPPKFTNDTTVVPKTASVGKQYQVQIAITDINADSLSLKQLGSLGLTISDSTLSWTPTIQDTGTKHVAIQASDGFGGLDTLEWNVRVTPVSVCAWGDSMPTARFSLGATVVNGTLYAVGGAKYINSGGKLTPYPFSVVEAYPLSGGGTWSKAAPLISKRYELGCAGSGGKLFSFGGTKDGANHFATIDSFSATGAAWDTAATLPVPLMGCAVCAIGTKVYCIGGISRIADENIVSDGIYEFDITTSQFVLKSNMMTKRTFHQAVALGGKIYIIGGLGGSSSLSECVAQSSMEVFDPMTGMVGSDTLAPLTTPRYYFGAAEANGKLYALGGCSSESSTGSLSSIEEYNPALNTWTVKADLPASRSNFATVSWQGTIYVIGGSVSDIALNTFKATSSVVIYYP
jgi:hypothetical protein